MDKKKEMESHAFMSQYNKYKVASPYRQARPVALRAVKRSAEDARQDAFSAAEARWLAQARARCARARCAPSRSLRPEAQPRAARQGGGGKVHPVEAAEAAELRTAGWVLLDVRPPHEVAAVSPRRLAARPPVPRRASCQQRGRERGRRLV